MSSNTEVIIRIKALKDAGFDAALQQVKNSFAGMSSQVESALGEQARAMRELNSSMISSAAGISSMRMVPPDMTASFKLKDGLKDVADASVTANTHLNSLMDMMTKFSVSSLHAASDAEQFTARLKAFTHDSAFASRSLDQINELSVSSKIGGAFNLESFRKAGIELTKFHQNIEENIQSIADLAASSGQSMEKTADIFSRAQWGNSRAYLQLQNVYGIQAKELERYGAELNKQGRIALGNAEQIEKAAQALKTYTAINRRGAAEEMGKTFEGDVQRFKNSLEVLKEEAGKPILPVASGAVEGLTNIILKLNQLPASAKSAIMNISALGAAGFMARKGIISVMEAVAAYNTILPVLVAKVGQAKLALESLASIPGMGVLLGPIGAIAAVIGTVATISIRAYEAEQKKLSERLDEESHQLQTTVQEWRKYRDIMNEALKAKGQFIEYDVKPQDVATGIGEKINTLSPREVVMEFKAQGIPKEKIEEEAAKAKQGAEGLRGSMEAVRSLYREVTSVSGIDPDKAFNIPGMMKYLSPSQNFSKEQIQEIVDLFGKEEVSINEVREKMKVLNVEYSKQSETSALLGTVIAKWESYDTVLDNSIEKAKQLKPFFDFSDKIGTVDVLKEKMKVLNTTWDEMKAGLSAQGLPTTETGLLGALKTSPNDEDKKQIESTLYFLREMKDTKKNLYAKEASEMEEAFNRKAQIVKMGGAEEAELYRHIIDVVKDVPELRQRYEDKLTAAVKKANQERVRSTEQAFTEDIEARRNYISRMAGLNEMNEAEQVKAYGRIKAEISKFKTENAALIKSSPELQKKVRQEEQEVVMGGLRAQKADNKKNLDDIKKDVELSIEQKKSLYKNDVQAEIDAIDQGIQKYKQAALEKPALEKKAHDAIEHLQNLRAQAEEKLVERNLSAEIKLNQEHQKTSSIRLQHLEKELQAGKDVQGAIISEVKKRLDYEMQMIDLKAQKELENSEHTIAAQEAIFWGAQNAKHDALEKEKSYIDSIIKKEENSLNSIEARTKQFGGFQNLNAFGEGKGLDEIPSISGFSSQIDINAKTKSQTQLQSYSDQLKSQINSMGLLDTSLTTLNTSVNNLTQAIAGGSPSAGESKNLADMMTESPMAAAGWSKSGFDAGALDDIASMFGQLVVKGGAQTSNVQQVFNIGGRSVPLSAEMKQITQSMVAACGKMISNNGILKTMGAGWGFDTFSQGGWGFNPVSKDE